MVNIFSEEPIRFAVRRVSRQVMVKMALAMMILNVSVCNYGVLH